VFYTVKSIYTKSQHKATRHHLTEKKNHTTELTFTT